MPVKVLFDSNILFAQIQFKVDIFSGVEDVLNTRVEAFILPQTLSELKGLAQSRQLKTVKEARTALKLAEQCTVLPVKAQPHEKTDDLIVRAAKECSCAVTTNDKELRKKLRVKGVPVIYLRQKSHFEVEGRTPV